MKRLIALSIIGLLLTGCAAKQSGPSPDYIEYLSTVQATAKPLVKITWDNTGQRMTSLEVTQPVHVQQKAPEAPHPAWGVATSVIKAAAVVGGIWAAGDAMQGVIEASRGTYSYNTEGSYNTSTTTTSTTSNNSAYASHGGNYSYPSGGGESSSGQPPTVTINKGGNTWTNNSNQGNTNNSGNTDNSGQDNSWTDNSTYAPVSNSNNPVDNSVNNSNNPVDNSITNPVTP